MSTPETIAAQILILELQLDRAGEIDQGLDDPVQAANLALDDVQVAQRIAADLDLVPQQLKVDDDGVDGILDFVPDAGSEAADRRHAPGNLQLGLDLPNRFEVVNGEQSAERMAVARLRVVDEVERDFDPAPGLGGHLFLHDRHPAFEGVADEPAEAGRAVEDLPDLGAENPLAADVEEALAGAGDQHGAGVAGEEHDPVLQIGEDLIEVLAQGAEDFLDVADALAEAFDLAGDLGDRVPAATGFGVRGCGARQQLRLEVRRSGRGRPPGEFLLRGQRVEALADLFDGLQREVRHESGDDHGDDHGQAHEAEGLQQPRLEGVAEKSGADPDADREEGLIVAVKTQGDVVDLGRAEDDRRMRLATGAEDGVVGTGGQDLIVEGGVRNGNDSAVLPVHDGDVQDRRRVVDDGGEQRVEAGIAAERIGDRSAHRDRIVGVEMAIAQAGIESLAHLKKHVVGEVVGRRQDCSICCWSNWLSQIQENTPPRKTRVR